MSTSAPPIELKERIAALEAQLAALEGRFRRSLQAEQLMHKAFRVIDLEANYVEFGTYRGGTLVQAAFAAWRLLEDCRSGDWTAVQGAEAAAERLSAVEERWRGLRFFAFDSFQGLPEPDTDEAAGSFGAGHYACSEAQLRAHLAEHRFPMDKLTVVPGFFEESCTAERAERIGLERVGVVHIDCDLYSSARTALEFITPYLWESAVVIFDDWFQFHGHPGRGEQRAFAEWRAAHPEFSVSDFHREGAWRNSFVLTR